MPIGSEKVKLTEYKSMTILPDHTTYEDGTECSETSAYKIQTPGIT